MTVAVGAAGFSATVTQLVLMRELLNVFAGNELVLGIVLGNWMLLMGLGASLGRLAVRRNAFPALIASQILQAILPVATIFLLRAGWHVVFLRGAAVGMVETAAACFCLLLPFCLSAGFFLPVASHVAALMVHDSKGDAEKSIGRVYWLDSMGGVVGGVIFTFVMIHFLDHFYILHIPAFLNLLCAILMAWHAANRSLLIAAGLVTMGWGAIVFTLDLDRISTCIEFAGQPIVYRGNSPYGTLIVAGRGGEYSFTQNGVPLFSTYNVEQVEETVHYAMAQRTDAHRVLLIGGGVMGTAREALKYGVQAVDYIELDPLILKVADRYAPGCLADPRIHVLRGDGRLWVKETSRVYDVVIVNVPEPMTFQLNRFYSQEFFQEVKRVMSPQGVLSFALGCYGNYVSRELADMIATAHRTLGTVFKNIVLIPSDRIFFLASDGELTTEIAARIEERRISTQLVNRNYLRAALAPDRMADVRRAVTSENARVNRDFNPVLSYYHLRYWISKFEPHFGILPVPVFLSIVLLVYLAGLRPVSFAVFTTGLAASVVEIVLLLGFQILYGNVYGKVGWVVALFMGGLAAGGFWMNRSLSRRTYRELVQLMIALAVFTCLIPPILMAMGQFKERTWILISEWIFFPCMVLAPAALVGMAFPLAGKLGFQGAAPTAARLYTADYVGASLGVLLVSALLIPLIGLTNVCLLTGGLCLACSFVVGLNQAGSRS